MPTPPPLAKRHEETDLDTVTGRILSCAVTSIPNTSDGDFVKLISKRVPLKPSKLTLLGILAQIKTYLLFISGDLIPDFAVNCKMAINAKESLSLS